MKQRTMNEEPRTKNGFTLLEVLVSMGIIALIAGLVLGGLGAAKRRAKTARARSDVHQLATAWNQYYADWRKFPNGIDFMDVNAVEILGGMNELENPRKIVYMDFNTNNPTAFTDPWGEVYQVELDAVPYDNKITADGNSLNLSAAVWSLGPDGTNADATSADNIASWMAK